MFISSTVYTKNSYMSIRKRQTEDFNRYFTTENTYVIYKWPINIRKDAQPH